MKKYIVLILLALLIAPSAYATDWYVDGLNGNDNNAGTSAAAAYKNGWKGTQAAQAGDTVHFLPTVTYSTISMMTSGTSSKPITVVGDGVAPNLTQVSGQGSDFGIQVNGGASYVIVKNFDIQAPGGWYGVYVGNASHNVQITGNTIHNAGGGGIGTTHADYINISHNVITNTAFFTTNGSFGSAISLYESDDVDTYTGIKNVIDSNIVYGNTNTPDCVSGVCAFGGLDSDGNGIILDDSRHTQSDNVAYKGGTMIQNNIVYGNGGRGIYTYFSDHALIINNTVYFNNQDPNESSFRPGEIMVQSGGGDIKIYNNIMFSDGLTGNAGTGLHVALSVESATDGVGTVYADYNNMYNTQNNPGLMYYAGSDTGHGNTNTVTFDLHNLWGNPLFNTASTNPTTADFHLQSTSPAFGSGLPLMASALDILGNARSTTTGPVDMGAYQQVPLPSCGPAKSVLSVLTGALCNVGTASSVTGTGPWSWSCANGGQTVSCSSVLVTNGTCGPANGAVLTSKPTTNLCSTGTATAVNGSGPWAWACGGINGGTNATCGASLQPAPWTVTVVAASDNYLGDATMGIVINGVQATTATVTAQHSANAWQTLTFSIPAPSVLNTFAITFLNDLYGGSKTADRNLYIQSVSINGASATPPQATYVTYKGVSAAGQQLMYNNGTMTWQASVFGSAVIPAPTPVVTAPTPDPDPVTTPPVVTPTAAACGSHASGTTYSTQLSQTTGTTTPTVAACPYGGTQATQTTVTQTYVCTDGTETAQGSSTSTTINTGSPTCNTPPNTTNASVTDGSGNVWTISRDGGNFPSTVMKNGTAAGFSAYTLAVVVVSGNVYEENTSHNWWGWNGTTWVAVSGTTLTTVTNAAKTACSSGASTCVVAADTIMDPQGNHWTISARGGINHNMITLNNAFTPSNGVIALLNYNGTIYQENIDHQWWGWNGSAWIFTTGSTLTGVASASKSACSINNSATCVVASDTMIDPLGNHWKIVNGVNPNMITFNEQFTPSNGVIALVNYNGTVYQENIDHQWWGWNGSAWVFTTGTTLTGLQAAAKTACSSSGATCVVATDTLMDTQGNHWNIIARGGPAPNMIAMNSHLIPSGGVVQLINLNGTIFQENTDPDWYQFNGTTWSHTTNANTLNALTNISNVSCASGRNLCVLGAQ